jgi:uncharacterized phage-associated protein
MRTSILDVACYEQKETIDAVIEAYGKLDSYQLSTLTHTETPWVNARGGIPSGTRSNTVITLDAMVGPAH